MGRGEGQDNEIAGRKRGVGGGRVRGDDGERQSPQQSQMNNAANVGRHASDASSRASGDDPKVKANDKAYNAALRNLPDKQFDPWRGVR